MGKLEIASDEQATQFETNLQEMLGYLKKCPNHVHFKTAQQLLNDNVMMYQRIKELEDGNTDAKEE